MPNKFDNKYSYFANRIIIDRNVHPHGESLSRYLHTQNTNEGHSASVVSIHNLGFSISETYFNEFMPDEAKALDINTNESHLRRGEHAGLINDIKRGKHLLEYIANPANKKKVFSYTCDLSGRVTKEIMDIINDLKEFDIDIKAENTDGYFSFDHIGISHDQSDTERSKHFNMEIKFKVKTYDSIQKNGFLKLQYFMMENIQLGKLK